MKILSGTLKGRNFFMPNEIRPTPDKVRKAVFDILGHDLSGLTFLELFAGSGSVGFEAISNGVKQAVLVEGSIRCCAIISDNITALKIKTYDEKGFFCQVMNADCFAAIEQLQAQKKLFDIVFADPPYNVELAKKTLKTLSACDILQRNCFVIIQHDKKESLPESEGRFLIIKQKKYGTSCLSVYQGQ
ncbi:MAG: 16S rRNA (guanine(966)-N(2))-methyltransferase RsmD [Candidatus Omnitrophota bacterium]